MKNVTIEINEDQYVDLMRALSKGVEGCETASLINNLEATQAAELHWKKTLSESAQSWKGQAENCTEMITLISNCMVWREE